MSKGIRGRNQASKRGVVQLVWRWLRKYVLNRWFVVIPFLLTIVTGVLGYELARSQSHFWDSLYRTIQLFGLNFAPLEETARAPGIGGYSHNWLIEFSRYLGAFTLAFGVIALFYTRLRDALKLLIQSNFQYRKRVVLLGFGSVNTALARELSHHSLPITVVSNQFTDADRAMAREHGILLLAGDLMDVGTLKHARIGKAAHIVVAVGNDVTNVEIGTAAAGFAEAFQQHRANIENQNATGKIAARPYGAGRSGKPVVKVHLSSTRTLADLTEARDIAYAKGAAASFFSIKTDSARKLVREAEFTRIARDKGQDRVHIVMCGVGDQGEALLVEILLNSFAVSVHDGKPDVLKPPLLTLIDVEGQEKLKARLKAHRPRLFDDSIAKEARPEIRFLDGDAMSICFDANEQLDKVEDECPVTAWIFACGHDSVNLAAAMRLEMAMHQLKRDPAPIYTRLWGADIATGDVSSEIALEERNPLLFTRPFGAVSQVMPEAGIVTSLLNDKDYGAEDIGLETEDVLAVLLHADYWETAKQIDANSVVEIASAGAPIQAKTINLSDAAERFTRAWHALPENVKEANFRAIRHLPVKLEGLGLDWQRGRLFPSIDKGLSEDLVGFLGNVEMIKNKPVYTSNFDPAIAKACELSEQMTKSAEKKPIRDLINAIAMIEHSRWMIDRALEGWRQAPDNIRDNRRRLHSKMRDFGGIGQDRELDLNGLRKILRYLGEPERASENRPIARLKCVAQIAVADGVMKDPTPKPEALKNATELKIAVGGSGGLGEHVSPETRDLLIRILRDWLASSSFRLHFLLDIPIDPGQKRSLSATEKKIDGKDYLHWSGVLSNMIDIVDEYDPSIEVRVTRRYRREVGS